MDVDLLFKGKLKILEDSFVFSVDEVNGAKSKTSKLTVLQLGLCLLAGSLGSL